MSRLKNEITTTLLQQPDLLHHFPWYPTACLAHPDTDNNLQKLAAFVNHPLRVHLLLSDDETAKENAAASIDNFEIPEANSHQNMEAASEIIVHHDEPAGEEKLNIEADEPLVEIPAQDDEPQEEIAAPTDLVPVNKPVVLPDISMPSSGKDAFLFQPFHTVDYFASLGIKADQLKIETTTRFDTQLKSFSQWLKVMKRADYQTGQFIADPAVEAQAKASLEVKEVVTEAMADVLAQQGRQAQAIEIYHKLTLLHPEKSAFFATQIEKLKA
jgi:hypothetical protein